MTPQPKHILLSILGDVRNGGKSVFQYLRRSPVTWLYFFFIPALLADGCGATGTHLASITGASVQDQASEQPQPYRVRSGSMEPTLPLGTRVTVKKGRLVVGAIVVAHPPQGFDVEECGPKPHVLKAGGAACDTSIPEEAKVKTIKRIVAAPGDTLYIRSGHVYWKGNKSAKFIQESDSYIGECGTRPECNFPVPIKIPAGHWFLMGDNRGESDDSRFWGPVPTAWIVGVATDYRLPRY